MKVIKCESCSNDYLSFSALDDLKSITLCPKCAKVNLLNQQRRERQKKVAFALVIVSVVFIFAWYLPIAI